MAETKYGHLISTEPIIKLPSGRMGVVSDGSELGAACSMAFSYLSEPQFMVKTSYKHDFAHLTCFFGTNPKDLTEFDAEIELCLGEEEEKHIITKPTIVSIPAGFAHCPLNFKKINKPIVFLEVMMTNKYSRQTPNK